MRLLEQLFAVVSIVVAIRKDGVVHGQVAGPNTVAPINGQAMLDCNTNDLSLSNWRHSPDGTNNYLTIANGCLVNGNNAAYYRTEVLGGNICRLIIANVTMQQAGVYLCYDGATTVYKSLVTVIDPTASIVVYIQSEVVEGDELNISCSINYNGPASPAPSLRPSPFWTTSTGQKFTSATYHGSVNVVTVVAVVTVQKPTVPIFQCRTVFEITGNTVGYNPTLPSDNLTVGSTVELNVKYPNASIVASTILPSTAAIANTCAPCATPDNTTSMSSSYAAVAVAIAMGVLFGISLVVNIILLVILNRNAAFKKDLFRRTERTQEPPILQPSDLSTPSAYEDLRRPNEIGLQPTNYEQLAPRPTLYVNVHTET